MVTTARLGLGLTALAVTRWTMQTLEFRAQRGKMWNGLGERNSCQGGKGGLRADSVLSPLQAGIQQR